MSNVGHRQSDYSCEQRRAWAAGGARGFSSDGHLAALAGLSSDGRLAALAGFSSDGHLAVLADLSSEGHLAAFAVL